MNNNNNQAFADNNNDLVQYKSFQKACNTNIFIKLLSRFTINLETGIITKIYNIIIIVAP